MFKPEILFLQQEDVIAAGALDMKQTLGAVEKAFYLLGLGKIKNPAKTIISLPYEDNWDSFFVAMPVYIGAEINRPGFKWAAESRGNSKTGDLPMGIDIIILSDKDTVRPVAIMDGTLITAMRTAACAGVAAKYLAPSETKLAACVGAGVIGRTMIMSLQEVLPKLKKIKLFDLDLAKAKRLAAEFAGKLEVVPTATAEEAIRDAQVIATMTTSRKPFVQKGWLRPGALVIQMGPHEVEEEILIQADKKVVDNWVQMKNNHASSFKPLVDKGIVTDADIVELKEIVAGQRPGRTSAQELITFASLGMGSLDVMVADYIYKKAREKGLGKKLMLWDEAKWL